MATLGNMIGLKGNNIIMYLGPLYVYPQIFILTWWSKFVSININNLLNESYKIDLSGLIKRYQLSKLFLISIFSFSYISIIIGLNFKSEEPFSTFFDGLGIVFIIVQILVIINILLGFIRMNKVINQGLRAINNDNLDTIVTYFFLPLTLGSIQKNIKLILKELNNNGIQQGV
jgi:hypothetical protein